MIDIPAATAQDPLAIVLKLLEADAPRTIMSAPQDWPRRAVLLPHVLAATSHLTVAGTSISAGDEAGWLLDRAATYLQVHARLAEARPLQERAQTIIDRRAG